MNALLYALLALLPLVGREAQLAGARATDLGGAVHSLDRAVALVFLGTTCPVSTRSLPALAELARLGEELGVPLFGVLSDPAVRADEARGYGRRHDLAFPLLYDASGDLAQRLAPTHVPEAFVTDAGGRVVYRGRIDDAIAAVGVEPRPARAFELRSALRAVAAGRRPAVARTTPVGCLFEAWEPGASAGPVTWTRDVAPILRSACQACHRTGDVAPFPLVTYEDAQRRARMIAAVTEARLMPPWPPGRSGASLPPAHGGFANRRGLSEREREVLAAWAAAGAPEGAPDELLPAPELPPPGWELGAPDRVLSVARPIAVPAAGDDFVRCFVLPLGADGVRFATALEIRPGARSAVHHAALYLDRSGAARRLDAADAGEGYDGAAFEGPGFRPRLLDVWRPGQRGHAFPAGHGLALPAGADLVLRLHYRPNGVAAFDRSSVGLYLAPPGERLAEVARLLVGAGPLALGPDEPDSTLHASMVLPADATVVDLLPHMHALGRAVRIEATPPGGATVPLLALDAWDFRWQERYRLLRPVALARGTRLDLRFEFERPPAAVRAGRALPAEAADCLFTVLPARPEDAEALWRASLASFHR
ncbi:MAG: redoxin domain-containing protein [Planctomycetota bacterium]